MGLFPLDEPRYSAIYAEEAAMVDAAELIAEALETSGMSQADLARALGISRSEVTARLRGERNITVRKLAETLHALGNSLTLGSSVRDTGVKGRDAVVTAFVARTPHRDVSASSEEGQSSDSLRAFARTMAR